MYSSQDSAMQDIGSGAGFGTDELVAKLVYASGADTPVNTSTVPTFIGQFYLDTANADFYIATGTSAATDFKQITA